MYRCVYLHPDSVGECIAAQSSALPVATCLVGFLNPGSSLGLRNAVGSVCMCECVCACVLGVAECVRGLNMNHCA